MERQPGYAERTLAGRYAQSRTLRYSKYEPVKLLVGPTNGNWLRDCVVIG